MSSILSDFLVFKESKEQYTREERFVIYNQFQERIDAQNKKRAQLLLTIETKQKQEIFAIKKQTRKVLKYRLINNYAFAEKHLLNHHQNN